ncbi:Parva [Phodopus roborovskii]|uniref:Parva protein n=1 Tax=Phodopus roborovskii TaxID=109678 RepID=A0AAU9ZMQ2_PHORO|nr:Parva [Phodopus roborovskii]
MATSPQKSPSAPKSPTPKSPPSRKKDDSFLGKLGGTLARRKKAKEDLVCYWLIVLGCWSWGFSDVRQVFYHSVVSQAPRSFWETN